mgnify:CR=1 FL=1
MKDRSSFPPALGIIAAYFLFFILFLWPLADFFSSALPLRWSSVQWRYGSVGLIGALMATPLLAIGFSMILAFVLQHRAILGTLSIICFTGCLFLILAMISLTLDVLQLWQLQPAEGSPSLKIGGLITGMKLFLGLVSLFLFGMAGWKASQMLSESSSSGKPVVRPPGPALRSERSQGDEIQEK